MSELRLLAPFHIVNQAHELAPFIEEAAQGSNGKFLAIDISRLLLKGEWRIWTARDKGELKAVLMTRFMYYPQVKCCELLAAVGVDRDVNMIPFMPDIEAWAKASGCRLLQPIARRGWERALKPLGFSCSHVLLEKRLDDAP